MNGTDKAVVAELRALAQENGGVLKPEVIVKAARDPKSALHDKFEWDDSEAAQRYRIWQARVLMNVVVEYLPSARGEMETRVFVSLTSDRVEGGYRTTADVYSDTRMREELFRDALDDLERIKLKYSRLKELVPVFAAIKKVMSKAKKRLGR